jgi:hypothetical protein
MRRYNGRTNTTHTPPHPGKDYNLPILQSHKPFSTGGIEQMLLYMRIDILQECVECTNAHTAKPRQTLDLP